MIVITGGSDYMDIDAYACAVSYAELLKLQGYEALALSTSILNESITPRVKSWNSKFSTDYTPTSEDVFIVVDVSNPIFFDKSIDLNKVVEVIDHHIGFEEYWKKRIGEKSNIEFIGAASTLIYEKWKVSDFFDKMSALSAKLLLCGIADNTLNLKASITTNRDIEAYNELANKAKLSKDWIVKYFIECQESILEDINTALKNDNKIMSFKTFKDQISFAQLVVWDSEELININQDQIKLTLSSFQDSWFLNLISLKEGRSYFITDNSQVKVWLEELLSIEFVGNIAKANRQWLRKELAKQDILNSQF